jgi:hypothetical protein
MQLGPFAYVFSDTNNGFRLSALLTVQAKIYLAEVISAHIVSKLLLFYVKVKIELLIILAACFRSTYLE